MKVISLLVASLSGLQASSAIEYLREDIDYYDGRILIDYRVKLDISASSLRDKLKDYESFSALSPIIVSSHIKAEDNQQMLYQTLRPCFLGVCYSLKKQERIRYDGKGRTIATIVPNTGHFESGMEKWFVDSNNQGTFLNYQADLSPGFPVPPLVGPMIIKNIIQRELHDIVLNLV